MGTRVNGVMLHKHFSGCLPWYALYVKPRHEKHVAVAVDGKGYEVFVPTFSKKHAHSKEFRLPLFPGYVFCRMDVSRPASVLSTPGVFSIVGNGGVGESISEEEVEALRRVIASGLASRPWPAASIGDHVTITSGPLCGVKGVLLDVSDGRWFIVSVSLLKRAVAVKLARDSVTPVRTTGA